MMKDLEIKSTIFVQIDEKQLKKITRTKRKASKVAFQ